MGALEFVLVGLAAARKAIAPRRGRGLCGARGPCPGCLRVVDVDKLVLMAVFEPPLAHAMCHWLASIYVLPHNRPAGVCSHDCWRCRFGRRRLLAGVGPRSRDWRGSPEHGRYQFTGITTQARFAYGKTGVTIAALLVAIEWPLHLNGGVQSILTTQVAIYVLLAMGLNVVVGFAGLLDLGYVAFWAIGAYTTAFFTGALPIHPPFILNPFWVIPFSIVAAMLAGVLLGTPTLRLRGDYLAIVTLGFGEIIEIVANNLNGVTGGPAGTPGFIPQFSVHIFGISYRWTGTVLPYYYLILGVAVVFAIAFSFLEHSRVGTVLDGNSRR